MPLVTVESWEDTTRTSKAGKEYDCTVFYGTKHGYQDAPDEPWEKAMVPWADGEWIKEIQAYPMPSKLLIKNEKVGQNWRIVSIEGWSGAKKKPGSEDTPSPTPGGGSPVPHIPNVPVIPQGLIATGNVMSGCVRDATMLVRGMMDNAETFKSLIKKSANTDLIIQLTKDIANQLYREIMAKENNDKPEADSSAVEPESDDMKEVEVPMD